MRTLKNLSLTLLTIALTNFLTSAAILGRESYNKNTFSKKSSVEKSNKQFVHTTLHKGKMIPSINLPEVIITASRSTKNMVGVVKRGNSLIAVVNLPEIIITGEKKSSGYRLRTVSGSNGNTPVVDFAEVEIVADRVNNNSLTWIETNGNKIPVVDLPEVIVSADFPEYNKIATVFYKGHFIPSVNLPEVEITAEKPDRMVAAIDENSTEENSDALQAYLPSVEAKTEKNISSVLLILAKAIFLK